MAGGLTEGVLSALEQAPALLRGDVSGARYGMEVRCTLYCMHM